MGKFACLEKPTTSCGTLALFTQLPQPRLSPSIDIAPSLRLFYFSVFERSDNVSTWACDIGMINASVIGGARGTVPNPGFWCGLLAAVRLIAVMQSLPLPMPMLRRYSPVDFRYRDLSV